MKKSTSNTGILFLLLFFGNTPSIQAQESSDSWIRSIRSEVAAINAPGKHYRMEEDDSTEISSEGSTIKKYYDGSFLRKATVEAFGAMGNTQTELYFSGGQLIFCYEVTKLYGGPIADEHRPLLSNERDRYYLHKDRLFRFINTKGKKIEGKALQEKEKALLQLKKLLKL